MDNSLEVITDAQMWALVVGFISPLLIAVVQQPRWRGPIRVLVTLGWAVVTAFGTAYFTGEFSGRGVLSCFLVIAVTAISSYQSIWVPTRIAPAIEARTSRHATIQTQVDTSPAAIDERGATLVETVIIVIVVVLALYGLFVILR